MSQTIKHALTVMVMLGLSGLLTGCEEAPLSLLTVEVQLQDTTFEVRASGELVASESIPVALPVDLHRGFSIGWLIPEYSDVTKGQVVARFDAGQMQSVRAAVALQITQQQLQLKNKTRMNTMGLTHIEQQALRVTRELDIAAHFVNVDPALYSQNELIDALGDRKFLQVEGEYYDWQAATHEQRSDAEKAQILANRDAAQLKLDKQDAAITAMQLRSPADGTFVYARSAWGAKLARGSYVFAGRAVGQIPVRGQVRARIFVPEYDAKGINEGQTVSITLDSAVERHFTATIFSVSPVAVARRREDPQKYVVVEADIDEVDAGLMLVGSHLMASITTAVLEAALLLPQQAVYFSGGDAFVTVFKNGQPSPRQVELGRSGPTLIEIIAGLEAGEQISVVAPESGKTMAQG